MVSIVSRAPALRELDISSNKLTASELSNLLSSLTPHNQNLTHLNLSWNSAQCPNKKEQNKFDEGFSHFIRYSHSLVHLDVSGMNFSEKSMKYFCLRGVRKSKTLLSVHMSGNFNNQHLLVSTRLWLNVITPKLNFD
jgi:hypothetical protein